MKKVWKYFAVGLFSLLSVNAWAAHSPLEEEYTRLPLHLVRGEGTLLYSDSPEYPTRYGVLAEGTAKKGKARVYYYHVNEMKKPARLVVYAKSDAPRKISVTRTLRGDPSRAYVPTGRTLSFREAVAEKDPVRDISLSGGERVVIFEDNPRGVKPNDLVSGIVEIETETPVTIGTAILPMSIDILSETELQKAKYIPVDEHELRGTYDRDLYWETDPWDFEKGNAEIWIGEEESFCIGYDEIDKVARQNYGNYGITYHIRVKTKGKGTYRLFINPQGGAYMGTFRIGQNEKLMRTFRTDGGRAPRIFGHETTEDWMPLGIWTTGRDLLIRFIPAGATYLPLRFLLVKE